MDYAKKVIEDQYRDGPHPPAYDKNIFSPQLNYSSLYSSPSRESFDADHSYLKKSQHRHPRLKEPSTATVVNNASNKLPDSIFSPYSAQPVLSHNSLLDTDISLTMAKRQNKKSALLSRESTMATPTSSKASRLSSSLDEKAYTPLKQTSSTLKKDVYSKSANNRSIKLPSLKLTSNYGSAKKNLHEPISAQVKSESRLYEADYYAGNAESPIFKIPDQRKAYSILKTNSNPTPTLKTRSFSSNRNLHSRQLVQFEIAVSALLLSSPNIYSGERRVL